MQYPPPAAPGPMPGHSRRVVSFCSSRCGALHCIAYTILDADAGPSIAAELDSGTLQPSACWHHVMATSQRSWPTWGKLSTDAMSVIRFLELLLSSCTHIGYRWCAAGSGRPTA